MTSPRVPMTLARRITGLLGVLGLRELMFTRRHDVMRLVRTGFERAGSARLSTPALYGMDLELARIINRRGGVFIEAGGYDGYSQSNTYFLERFRGWTGILVEPMPQLAAIARRNRPGATVVQCALVADDFDGSEIAMEFGELMSTVSRPGASEWSARGLVLGWHDAQTVRVPARPLSTVIDAAGDPEIDLLSLDVEGYEVAALGGLDLSRHAPAWILIEMFDPQAGRTAVAPLLGDRYEEYRQLSPLDVLYRRRDVAA